MKCFYHSADLDGKCSAAIVRRKYPGIELIGINYGDKFPWDSIAPREPVVMVDFSLQPFEEMLRLRELTDALVWIDHHKTAMDDAVAHGWLTMGASDTGHTVHGKRRSGIGACVLAWEYLFPKEPVPRMVNLLGLYDVWDHSDPDTLRLQYGMRLEDTAPSSDIWSDVFIDNAEDVIRNGHTVLKYEEMQNAIRARAMSFETEIDGLRCIAANQGLTNSKLFDGVFDPEKHDAMLCFSWRKGKYTVSLYTDKDGVDVGAVAKARGGGGHVGAAGFQCDELPAGLLPCDS